MEDIFISGDPLLESVGLHEPLVEELRASITNAMRKAMIPLQVYAKEYRKYLELNNNDITAFLKYVRECMCQCICVSMCRFVYTYVSVHVCRHACVCLFVHASPPILLTTLCSLRVFSTFRTYQIQCPSAEEVREVVITHLQEKEILDNSLPSSIVIGPFYINVDNVKQSLSKKRKALATSMLDILAKNLHKKVDNVSNDWPVPNDHGNTQAASHAWCMPTSKMLQVKTGVSSGAWVKEGTWKSPLLMPVCIHLSPYANKRLIPPSLDF